MLHKYNTKIFVILHGLEINAKEKFPHIFSVDKINKNPFIFGHTMHVEL